MVSPAEETNLFRKETEALFVEKGSLFHSGFPNIPHGGATFESISRNDYLNTLRRRMKILHLNVVLDDGNISIPDPSIIERLVDSFNKVTFNVSVPPKTTEFCDRDKHSMVFKGHMALFKCDGCKQQGSGPRRICDKCNYEVDEYCMHPKAFTFFDYYDETGFRFFPSPQPSEAGGKSWCNTCTEQILGFNYQSVDGKLDLHPCCGKLPKKLQIKGIDTLFDLREKTLAKCICCLENKVSSSPAHIQGLEYASRCGLYHFHVHCMMEYLHIRASAKDDNYVGIGEN